MSWPMQTPGSWNPGMAVTPDMMGSYTPEQWAAMQNWQNYTQWQQQYAQWQSQYGEKYAKQMQAMQSMGGMPPLPPAAAAPPPAPPPPDNPPPPPHENNQPLYGHIPSKPAPVPAPNASQQRSQNPANNVNVNTQLPAGNNQNWSYGQESSLATVNADALKKLAEEERLFDIQFLKWEEEIEKWRKDNVNHPDKETYKEYEDRFQACRAQLMVRRQIMNSKKASLMGTNPPLPPPAAKPSVAANTNSAPLPPPPPPSNNVNLSKQQQNHGNNVTPSLNKQQNYGKSLHNVQNYGNNAQNYSDSNNYQYQQYNMPPNQNAYNKSINMVADNQERFNKYSNSDKFPPKDTFAAAPNNPSFLLASESNKKGIPGLDLVPDTDKSYKSKQDVIDITEDQPSNQSSRGPDYSTISKGINNILGDEKIMNILSMVSRAQVSSDSKNCTPSNQNSQQGHFDSNSHSNSPFDPGFRNQNYGNKQYDNSQNNMPYANRQGGNYQQQNQEDSRYMPHQKRQDEMNQDQYGNYNSNNQYGGNNMGSYDNGLGQGGPPPGRPNAAGPIRPLMKDLLGPNDFTRGPPVPQNAGNNFPHGPGAEQQNDYSRGSSGPQNDFNRGPPGSGQRNDFRGPGAGMQNDYNRGLGQQDYCSRPPGPPGPPERRPLLESNMNINQIANASMPKWIDEPMFNPSLIVEYEHKPLRLKARDFIEPVHMFDYNHKSKDGDIKKKDFEKEVDELFSRKSKRDREYDYSADRYSRDYSRDFERRAPREDLRDELRVRGPPKDDYEDRRRFDEDRRKLDEDRRRLEDERRRLDNRYDDRRKDDRDHYRRRDDMYRERDKDYHRDRDRGRDTRREDIRRDDVRRDDGRRDDIRRDDVRRNDGRRDDLRRDDFRRDDLRRDDVRRDDLRRDDRHRSRSRERDLLKRGLSRESEISDTYSKRSRDKDNVPASQFDQPKHVVMIDDLLEYPGREMRPQKIVIILRGLPGSGKSYLAKLIRDREAEQGGTVRIMSIDDYFMQEGEVEEKDPTTGKMVKKPTLKYEYDEASEESYMNSLKRAFRRSLTDGYFSFIIFDANNETLKSYGDVWNIARQNDFQVYICEMELDPKVCFKRNIHNRTLSDIETISARFYPTPAHHIRLDATTLLQSGAITEVHMEDVSDDVVMEDAQEPEVESVFTSKWEAMDDAVKLARLDGTSKPLRPSQLSMEDYLQIDDWKPTTAKPGKKTVRWADIEERREQEKARAIGFVVGQTDWHRMTDPTMGSSALTQTKYIERVRRN